MPATPQRIRAALRKAEQAAKEISMTDKTALTLNINGRDHAIKVEARRTLVDAIREDCGQTGTHIGCEHGICGACTVIVDGEPVRSCLMFAGAGGRQKDPHRRRPGQRRRRCTRCSSAFMDHHGLQCGFCTPGFLMLAVGVLEREPDISDDDLHRRAVVEPVPLHRLSEHHQGRRAAAAEMRGTSDRRPDSIGTLRRAS